MDGRILRAPEAKEAVEWIKRGYGTFDNTERDVLNPAVREWVILLLYCVLRGNSSRAGR